MPKNQVQTIEIDGSYGEGGGALLRTALLMSSVTQLPLNIKNIRGGGNHQGLDLEDTVILNSLAKGCHAKMVGSEIGSQTLTYTPSRHLGPISLPPPIKGTGRGSNTLVVLATLLPAIAKSGAFAEMTAVGETYGPNTLTYDYFANVTLSAARSMGMYAWTDQPVAGFGRENYGEVYLEAEPSVLTGVDWSERGNLVGCHALVVTSNLPPAVAGRAESHLNRLASYANVPLRVQTKDVPGSSPGTVITLWAEFRKGIGGIAGVGSRGLRVETIAQGAFESFAEFIQSGASVDSHLADQLFLFAIFSEGITSFKTPRVTRRLLTMAWVVKQFGPIHITITGAEDQPGTVTIRRS